MKIKQLIAAALLVSLITFSGCGSSKANTPGTHTPVGTVTSDTSAAASVNINTAVANEIPSEYIAPMKTLLSEWGQRKGSMSDPFIGARILMYEKTKDEVGFAVLDIDGNGVLDMIAAPIDDFNTNALVYDILTTKDGKAWHLANSLQATYHLMSDGSFILRTPNDDGSISFKRVTVNGSEKPIETPISEADAAKYTIAQIKLTPFSALEG